MKLINSGIYSEKNSLDTCIVYLAKYEKNFMDFMLDFYLNCNFHLNILMNK